MNIVLGATGQIGSMVVDNLLKSGHPVRAVVRNKLKAQELANRGVKVAIADYFDVEALKEAFYEGNSVFLLTPENPECENFLATTKQILSNYREAVLSSKITKIVGLSSNGAQHETGTGNLEASYMLENLFADHENIEQVYIRPSYYFSNWLGYCELVKENGVLPTFFPPKMKVPMIAPSDVAQFISDQLVCSTVQQRLYEITGPQAYSSEDIAKIYEEVFNRNVTVQRIEPENWENTLQELGFSEDGMKNFMLMTKAVIDGKTKNETTNPICFSTDFNMYLSSIHCY